MNRTIPGDLGMKAEEGQVRVLHSSHFSPRELTLVIQRSTVIVGDLKVPSGAWQQ